MDLGLIANLLFVTTLTVLFCFVPASTTWLLYWSVINNKDDSYIHEIGAPTHHFYSDKLSKISVDPCLSEFWSANMRQILIFDKSAYLEQVCNLIASPCIAVWTRNETWVCYRNYQEYGENHRNILSSINPIP